MLRREFLQLVGLRPILAAADQVAQPAEAAVDVRTFGAIGDGIKDDTAALQAALNHAIDSGNPCFIPSGRFRISAPLTVGYRQDRKLQQGFMLYGAGRTVSWRGGTGGTLIELIGSGHKAVIVIEKSLWRSASISDLGLECNSSLGADFGLLFNSTEFSGHAVRNVGVTGAKTGFGILEGTGANGEFTLFENCIARNVDTFFYSNAGQAYVQHFNHCSCLINKGGTYFHLDLTIGGGGLNVFDFNASGLRPDKEGATNTTLVKNSNSSSCMNFVGGRIENLTQLYSSSAGTTSLHVTAEFRGLQLTVDTVGTTKNFIDIQRCPDIVNIASCSFQGISGHEIVEVRTK